MKEVVQDGSPLLGKKIGVLVENKFIPEEISAYQTVFPALGAQVEFISRLWYDDYKPDATTFYSDVDPLDSQPWESPHTLKVSREISTVKPSDYAAVIMSANYTSVRLRYSAEDENLPPRTLVQSSPVVAWYAEAMRSPRIIKGALCHGLWILTPYPNLLKGRKVVCNIVVMADILNCGADAVMNPKVVVDKDLVTGYSKHEVIPFIRAVAEQVMNL
jgi:protease I